MPRSIRGGALRNPGSCTKTWVCSLQFETTWTRRCRRGKAVRNRRAHSDRNDGLPDGGALRVPFPLQVLGWTARDAVGFAVSVLATVAILINVLFLQSSSHP